jgi:hypothetical protein
MTNLAVPAVAAHNRVVLRALTTDVGQRLFGRLCALRYTGRRTGRTVTPPVGFAACGTDVMVLVGHADIKQWWHNFRGGHPAELFIDGRWRPARGEVVECDRLEYPRLLTGYRAAHPHVSRHTSDPIVHFVLTGDGR